MFGDTFPERAFPGSLRYIFRAEARRFGVGEIDTTMNCAHMSAGPFEALFEMKNCFADTLGLDFTIRDGHLAKLMSSRGVLGQLERALENPGVDTGTGQESLFNLTEGVDSISSIELLRITSPLTERECRPISLRLSPNFSSGRDRREARGDPPAASSCLPRLKPGTVLLRELSPWRLRRSSASSQFVLYSIAVFSHSSCRAHSSFSVDHPGDEPRRFLRERIGPSARAARTALGGTNCDAHRRTRPLPRSVTPCRHRRVAQQ
jgi:hypothetical protein